jgi:uncharacterized protein
VLELEERRAAILAEIGKQGKLTPELAAKLRRHDQGGARGSLPALQAQAPHPRDDRPRARPRAPRAAHPGAAGRGRSRAGGAPPSSTLEGGPDGRRRAQGRARHRRRDRSPSAPCARDRARGLREGGRARRRLRSPTRRSEPTKFEQYYDFRSRSRRSPRTASWRSAAARRKASCARDRLEAERVVRKLEAVMKLDRRSPFASELEPRCRRLQAPARAERRDRRARRAQDAADRAAVDVFADNLAPAARRAVRRRRRDRRRSGHPHGLQVRRARRDREVPRER